MTCLTLVCHLEDTTCLEVDENWESMDYRLTLKLKL